MKPSNHPQKKSRSSTVPKECEALITALAFGGDGVGRIDGQVIFVPFTIPGERVRVRIVSSKKGILRGKLLGVVEGSPNRVTPHCRLFGQCGGCQYQHIAYPAQVALKTRQVTDCLERIAKIPNPPVTPCVPSPSEYGYRNKITVHTRHGITGFTDVTGAKIIPVSHCPIASDAVNDQLHTFLRRRPPEGDHVLRHLPGESGELSLRAFHQTNTPALPLLLELTASCLPEKGDVLIDAYCGAGFFSFAFASRFQKVVGIEREPRAIAAAKSKQAEQNAENMEFHCGSVDDSLGKWLEEFSSRGITLLLDPPRTGCETVVIETIRQFAPAQIVYVSCDPATLARDIARLQPLYSLDEVLPLDMFPQTAHVECVARLSKV